jgi:hypothetical protein
VPVRVKKTRQNKKAAQLPARGVEKYHKLLAGLR